MTDSQTNRSLPWTSSNCALSADERSFHAQHMARTKQTQRKKKPAPEVSAEMHDHLQPFDDNADDVEMDTAALQPQPQAIGIGFALAHQEPLINAPKAPKAPRFTGDNRPHFRNWTLDVKQQRHLQEQDLRAVNDSRVGHPTRKTPKALFLLSDMGRPDDRRRPPPGLRALPLFDEADASLDGQSTARADDSFGLTLPAAYEPTFDTFSTSQKKQASYGSDGDDDMNVSDDGDEDEDDDDEVQFIMSREITAPTVAAQATDDAGLVIVPDKDYLQSSTSLSAGAPLWRLPVKPFRSNWSRLKKELRKLGSHSKIAANYHHCCTLIGKYWGCEPGMVLPEAFHNTTPYSLALLKDLRGLASVCKDSREHVHIILHAQWRDRLERTFLDSETIVSEFVTTAIRSNPGSQLFEPCERTIKENLYGIMLVDVREALSALLQERSEAPEAERHKQLRKEFKRQKVLAKQKAAREEQQQLLTGNPATARPLRARGSVNSRLGRLQHPS